MKRTPARKKPMLKEPTLFPLETEPTEIIEAMNLIVNHSENSGFSENMIFNLQKPIHYLCERLQISEKQAVLLSVVCELATEGAITTNSLAKFFGCSNLDAIAFIKDLDDLVDKRLLTIGKTYCERGKAYNIQWDMLTSYSHNEVYEPKIRYNTCEEMLLAIESMSHDYEDDITFREFHRQIRLTLEDNTHLAFTKALLNHSFTRNDQIVLINACLLLCCHDQYSFELEDFTRFVDTRNLQITWHEMLTGTHPLVKEGWIAPKCDDGLEDVEFYELTQKAKDELLSEVNLKPAKPEFKQFKDLIIPQKSWPSLSTIIPKKAPKYAA